MPSSPPSRKRHFFEFSLCLSRACLGKMMTFIYKWRKKCRFSPFSHLTLMKFDDLTRQARDKHKRKTV